MTSTKLSGVIYILSVGFFALICGLCLWTVLLHPPMPAVTTHTAPVAPAAVNCHYSGVATTWGCAQ